MPRDQQDVLRRNIRALLKERGMNLAGLASISTVAKSTLYNFYNEIDPTSLGRPSQVRIAAALGVTPDELNDPMLASERSEKESGAMSRIRQRLDRMGEEDRNEAIAMVEAILDTMDARKKRSAEKQSSKTD